jgi:hypothetical protein
MTVGELIQILLQKEQSKQIYIKNPELLNMEWDFQEKYIEETETEVIVEIYW